MKIKKINKLTLLHTNNFNMLIILNHLILLLILLLNVAYMHMQNNNYKMDIITNYNLILYTINNT